MKTITKPAKKVAKPAAKLTHAQVTDVIKKVSQAKLAVPQNPKEKIAELFAEAASTGSWMVAIWRVSDGQVHLNRESFNFPKEDRNEVVKMLQRDLDKVR